MNNNNTDLIADWFNYASASLETRINDTDKSTTNVLAAVQSIAEHLEDKRNLQGLLSLEPEQSTPGKVLELLDNIRDHLDSHDELFQLIGPLFSTLQFEDRTRQKLEGLIRIMHIWTTARHSEDISHDKLAEQLVEHVVTPEQRAILSRYFPEHIQAEEEMPDVSVF